jgi:hypothetical protein
MTFVPFWFWFSFWLSFQLLESQSEFGLISKFSLQRVFEAVTRYLWLKVSAVKFRKSFVSISQIKVWFISDGMIDFIPFHSITFPNHFQFHTFERRQNRRAQESFEFLGYLQYSVSNIQYSVFTIHFNRFAAISRYFSHLSLILQYFSIYRSPSIHFIF